MSGLFTQSGGELREARSRLKTGGSAIGLSANGAWAEPRPVMVLNVARQPDVPGKIAFMSTLPTKGEGTA